MWKELAATGPLKTTDPAAAQPVTEEELAAIFERLDAARDIFSQNRELREVLSRRQTETQALRSRNAELEKSYGISPRRYWTWQKLWGWRQRMTSLTPRVNPKSTCSLPGNPSTPGASLARGFLRKLNRETIDTLQSISFISDDDSATVTTCSAYRFAGDPLLAFPSGQYLRQSLPGAHRSSCGLLFCTKISSSSAAIQKCTPMDILWLEYEANGGIAVKTRLGGLHLGQLNQLSANEIHHDAGEESCWVPIFKRATRFGAEILLVRLKIQRLPE